MAPKLVIFDLDGTLVDTIGDVAACFNRALEKHDFPTHAPEKYPSLVGGSLEAVVSRLLPEGSPASAVDMVKDEYRRIYRESSKPLTKLYPGISDCLTRLQNAGIALAVNTNKGQDLAEECIQDLLPGFELAIEGYRVSIPPKPDPAGAIALADRMGVDPADCVYVGDGPTDVSTAKNAGMQFVFVEWGQGTCESCDGIIRVRNAEELCMALTKDASGVQEGNKTKKKLKATRPFDCCSQFPNYSTSKRKVSLLVPCYNEVGNVRPMAEALTREMDQLTRYNYEIVFIDNRSDDGTREELREIVKTYSHVKAIFNTRNFGQFKSPYYGICQTTGDCTISISCDFQDPVELVPEMISAWEDGYKIVCPVKTSSKESGIMYFLRSCYYGLVRKMSDVEQIDHFTGFGLYDRTFVDVMRSLDDPEPFLRGIVAELGPADRKVIPYEQQERKSGATHNGFWSLYDGAMISFTSYTKTPMRMATLIGFAASGLSLLAALVYLFLKLFNWYTFPAGSIPILLAVLVLGSFQLLFIGVLGEYVLSINSRTMRRPLVVEQERIGSWGENESA